MASDKSKILFLLLYFCQRKLCPKNKLYQTLGDLSVNVNSVSANLMRKMRVTLNQFRTRVIV